VVQYPFDVLRAVSPSTLPLGFTQGGELVEPLGTPRSSKGSVEPLTMIGKSVQPKGSKAEHDE
jgi:hypothetical protein